MIHLNFNCRCNFNFTLILRSFRLTAFFSSCRNRVNVEREEKDEEAKEKKEKRKKFIRISS